MDNFLSNLPKAGTKKRCAYDFKMCCEGRTYAGDSAETILREELRCLIELEKCKAVILLKKKWWIP